jgi:DNA polymerase I-like protein with 3'-5' exonuclease and polymerase domains
MKVLINYQKEEKAYLPIVGGMLKESGHTVVTSPNSLKIEHLVELQKKLEIKALVLANEETLWNLTNGHDRKKITLDSFRGSVLQYQPKVLVVNSLAHIRTVKYGRWLLSRDLEKLGKLDEQITIPTYDLLETEAQFLIAFNILRSCLIISIDIETDQHARITCVSYTGLKGDGRDTYSCLIPFFDFGEPHWADNKDWERAIYYMRSFNRLENAKLMFNAGYDASYFIRDRAEPRNLILDGMGIAHSCWSELPKDLAFWCSLWDPSYIQWKHEADLARKRNDIRTYWYYCVKDSFNTLKTLLLCYPNAPEWMVRNYQIKFKLTYPCLYCAFEGIKVNAEKKTELAEQAKRKLEEARHNLQTMAADPKFNPGSWQQIAKLIYKILGASPTRHGESTNVKVLNQVAEQHPLFARFIDQIIEYRKEAKAYGTYFTFDELNGRLLYNIGPFGTDTGRMSSTGSNFHVGTQVQNIPIYAKGMLEADPGYTLFEPDNSKAEARIVAEISRCLALQSALRNPEKDFYKQLGTIFFGIPYDEVSKELRDKVLKRIVHGTNYMMGTDTFIDNAAPAQIREGARLLGTKLSKKYTMKDFVEYLIGLYHRKFPEVSKHYVELQNEINLSHTHTSVLGYTRYFFGDIINDHNILRGAVAHEPQNLNVDILNIGFWKVYQLVLQSKGEVRLKAQIHDSILTQIRTNKLDFYRPIILELMRNPVTIHGREFTIPVEEKSGPNFAELK